jgi:general secretion pathway protein G
MAAYTIIEMMVVMAVLGLLASAAMPLVELTVKRNKERELRAAVWEIRRAIDAYKEAYDQGRIERTGSASGYPPSLTVLVSGAAGAGTAAGTTFYALRRLPRDPFAPTVQPAADGWGVRSYASPPEAPAAGGDVFDVFSRSEGRALNGTLYREW